MVERSRRGSVRDSGEVLEASRDMVAIIIGGLVGDRIEDREGLRRLALFGSNLTC